MRKDVVTDVTLKEMFEKTFPEYALRLNKVTTQKEIEVVYNQIVGECHKNLMKAYQEESGGLLKGDSPEGIGPFAILPDLYSDFLEAKYEDVKVYITQLLNAIQLVKPYLDHNDKQAAATQLVASGIGAITIGGVTMYFTSLLKGATTFAAALEVMTSCTAGIVETVIFIVALVVIPIVYFIEKPAANILLLINDLEERIVLVDNDCEHGKLIGKTPRINAKVSGAPGGIAGGYVSSKKDDALIGSSTGYHFQTENSKKDFYIGVECPLSSLYGGNTCYCSFEGSAKEACEKANKNQTLESNDEKDGYRLDIKCNSKSGSVAYYIARIYKG